MTRKISTWLAAAGCVAALAGCGGGEGSSDAEEAPPGPSIPADVAESLASESDRLADLLAEVRTCDAAHQADVLADAVEQSAAEIPDALEAELVAVVTELQNGVNCPEPVDEDDDDDEDEDEGKGKGKGKDKEDESVTDVTTTVVEE